MVARWTNTEDQVLRDHCRSLSLSQLAARLPHRTCGAISHRAQSLGCHVAHWSPHERAVLRRDYPAGGSKAVQQHLPHRTRGAIQDQARRLGIVVPRRGRRPGPPGRRGDLQYLLRQHGEAAKAMRTWPTPLTTSPQRRDR